MADGNGIINILETGLRTAGLRSKVIADNLANANTPGFRRRAVAFEKAMADALASGSQQDLATLKAEIIQPRDTAVGSNGNDVSLDREVGEMVKNSARAKTYVRVLRRIYRQMDAAMRTQ